MSGAAMVFKDPETETTFEWHGGEYIEVGYVPEGGEFVAGDVINVWDHGQDKPRIARSLDAFEERCQEYLAARRAEDDE